MIVKESWGVLKQDKEILWFPVLSALTMLAVYAVVVTLYFFGMFGGDFSALMAAIEAEEAGTSMLTDTQEIISYLILFVTYLLSFLVVNFFQAGIMSIAWARFQGRDLTFGDGMRAAASKLGPIFVWSLISATVGLILDQISQRLGWAGKLIAIFLGAAWNILTFFSLPALVLGNATIIGSFKDSAAMIRKTWGETVIVSIGVGLFFGLVFLGLAVAIIGIGITAAVLSDGFGPLILLASFVILLLVLPLIVVVASALSSIFKVALFEYARTGIMPSGFTPALIQQAIEAKK